VQFLPIKVVISPPPRFAHRDNHDGSVDSICMDCVVTVATVAPGANLEKVERDHVCDPIVRARFENMRVH
jgi:hypothetical protein